MGVARIDAKIVTDERVHPHGLRLLVYLSGMVEWLCTTRCDVQLEKICRHLQIRQSEVVLTLNSLQDNRYISWEALALEGWLTASIIVDDDVESRACRRSNTISKARWQRLRGMVFQRDGGHCVYCDVPLTIDEFSVDHVIPRAKGGSDELQNLVLSCQSCNSSKGIR